MSDYILLLRGGIEQFDTLSAEDRHNILQRYRDWATRLQAEDKLVDASQLDDDGRRLLKKADKIQVDGPFTETKETIGGYYLIQAQSFDEITQIAKDCPIFLAGGTVEIREIQQ